MAPLIALVVITLAARVAGLAGVGYTDTWPEALAVGLAGMFVLTASAHALQPRRDGLIAMVPPAVPSPAVMVSLTGVLELAGAVGLLVPPTAFPGVRAVAAVCLAVLLVVMFPANVHAARGRGRAGAPQTPLARRTVLQVVYLAAAVTVAAASV